MLSTVEGEYPNRHHRAFIQLLMEAGAKIHSQAPHQAQGIETKRGRRDCMTKEG